MMTTGQEPPSHPSMPIPGPTKGMSPRSKSIKKNRLKDTASFKFSSMMSRALATCLALSSVQGTLRLKTGLLTSQAMLTLFGGGQA